MSSEGSVTRWLRQVGSGDAAAFQKLWERYFRRLVALARQKLRSRARTATDEEDVALSAFDSFCRGASRGRFPQLNNRDDLWRLLVTLTVRKAATVLRDQGRIKRGGRFRGEIPPAAPEESSFIEHIADREPTPAFAAQVAEECRSLLAKLDDAELQAIAVAKMEGYTIEEIAVQRGCAPRTVERRLRLIRRIWGQEDAA